ncbi:UNKNOWN [Stylonychia lemnae]|uniref:Uncharacterized protein n=1 Tax=Stylonychia lemnae TaxID=5949 RepID=A0A078A9J0_STYLE|nr:UNKNOWN [Stylonychia lemnae]|eukprot:CDW77458.1 UNKNOWN [Stylonychia lemnae]
MRNKSGRQTVVTSTACNSPDSSKIKISHSKTPSIANTLNHDCNDGQHSNFNDYFELKPRKKYVFSKSNARDQMTNDTSYINSMSNIEPKDQSSLRPISRVSLFSNRERILKKVDLRQKLLSNIRAEYKEQLVLKTIKKPTLYKPKPKLQEMLNLRDSAFQGHIDQQIRNRFKNKHVVISQSVVGSENTSPRIQNKSMLDKNISMPFIEKSQKSFRQNIHDIYFQLNNQPKNSYFTNQFIFMYQDDSLSSRERRNHFKMIEHQKRLDALERRNRLKELLLRQQEEELRKRQERKVQKQREIELKINVSVSKIQRFIRRRQLKQRIIRALKNFLRENQVLLLDMAKLQDTLEIITIQRFYRARLQRRRYLKEQAMRRALHAMINKRDRNVRKLLLQSAFRAFATQVPKKIKYNGEKSQKKEAVFFKKHTFKKQSSKISDY